MPKLLTNRKTSDLQGAVATTELTLSWLQHQAMTIVNSPMRGARHMADLIMYKRTARGVRAAIVAGLVVAELVQQGRGDEADEVIASLAELGGIPK